MLIPGAGHLPARVVFALTLIGLRVRALRHDLIAMMLRLQRSLQIMLLVGGAVVAGALIQLSLSAAAWLEDGSGLGWMSLIMLSGACALVLRPHLQRYDFDDWLGSLPVSRRSLRLTIIASIAFFMIPFGLSAAVGLAMSTASPAAVVRSIAWIGVCLGLAVTMAYDPWRRWPLPWALILVWTLAVAFDRWLIQVASALILAIVVLHPGRERIANTRRRRRWTILTALGEAVSGPASPALAVRLALSIALTAWSIGWMAELDAVNLAPVVTLVCGLCSFATCGTVHSTLAWRGERRDLLDALPIAGRRWLVFDAAIPACTTAPVLAILGILALTHGAPVPIVIAACLCTAAQVISHVMLVRTYPENGGVLALLTTIAASRLVGHLA